MGGLMSLYCIAKYNNVYSKAACLSSTLDITHQGLVDTIRSSRISKNTRIYMDFGSNEVRTKRQYAVSIDQMLEINYEFQKKKCNTFPNKVVGGYHSEATWETMVPVFLEYLYPELYRKRK